MISVSVSVALTRLAEFNHWQEVDIHMGTFGIKILPGSLQVDSRVPLFVAGRVWLELAGKPFPVAEWSDAPLSVIGSLGTAISRVPRWGSADFYFFEGPYFVKLVKEGGRQGGCVKVFGICDRDPVGPVGEGVVEAQATVSLHVVRQSYNQACQTLRDWAIEHRESEVIEVLSRASLSDVGPEE